MTITVDITNGEVLADDGTGSELVGASQPRVKLTKRFAGAPAVTNDVDDGFIIGSMWVNTSTGIPYFCADATAGAAVWTQMDTAAGDAPSNAQYVTLATDATLTVERVLTAGHGVDLVDGGAGSTVTVDVDETELDASLLGGTIAFSQLASLAIDRALVSDGSGDVSVSLVTATELSVLDGITSSTAELNILDGVTATFAELNILDGVTSTTAELNILDGVTATFAELNILDGVTSTTAELNILDGVTATFAELNKVDQSAETETIAEGGVVSAVLRVTQIASAGAGAVTLAPPNAAMIGWPKVVEMTTDGGDVTLATTNIVGSGGATITFDAVGDAVALVGGVAAWIYVGGSAAIT